MRSTEKPASLYRRSAENSGCVTPSPGRICLREFPLGQPLIQRIREAQLGLTFDGIGEAQVGEHVSRAARDPKFRRRVLPSYPNEA